MGHDGRARACLLTFRRLTFLVCNCGIVGGVQGMEGMEAKESSEV